MGAGDGGAAGTAALGVGVDAGAAAAVLTGVGGALDGGVMGVAAVLVVTDGGGGVTITAGASAVGCALGIVACGVASLMRTEPMATMSSSPVMPVAATTLT